MQNVKVVENGFLAAYCSGIQMRTRLMFYSTKKKSVLIRFLNEEITIDLWQRFLFNNIKQSKRLQAKPNCLFVFPPCRYQWHLTISLLSNHPVNDAVDELFALLTFGIQWSSAHTKNRWTSTNSVIILFISSVFHRNNF